MGVSVLVKKYKYACPSTSAQGLGGLVRFITCFIGDELLTTTRSPVQRCFEVICETCSREVRGPTDDAW